MYKKTKIKSSAQFFISTRTKILQHLDGHKVCKKPVMITQLSLQTGFEWQHPENYLVHNCYIYYRLSGAPRGHLELD